ncbi:MAG: glycosyltransferase family 4 protein [Candidatus Hodarchaeota archaeon]
MRLALLYYDKFPHSGGIGYVIEGLYRSFKYTGHKLFLFNPNYEAVTAFPILKKRYHSRRDLIELFLHPKLIKMFIEYSWKIISNVRLPGSHRLRMLLYLILKPDILLNTLKNSIVLIPKLRKLNVDILIGGASDTYTITLINLLSLFLNKKSVSLAYGNDFLVRSRYSLKSYYYQSLNLIFFGTNVLRDLFQKIHHFTDKSRLKVIPYGLILKDYKLDITKNELRKRFNISSQDFVMLSVGRHVPRKNFDLVIKALKIIVESTLIKNIKYYLIGEGPSTPELKSLVKKLELNDFVEFLGFTPREMRNYFYKLSDVLLMPSLVKKESIEGFGIVFIEANFYKIPVIGARTGGIIEAIIEGETGLLIKPGDVNDLVEKVTFLYKNPDAALKMGERGHKRVLEKFDILKNSNIYLKEFLMLM